MLTPPTKMMAATTAAVLMLLLVQAKWQRPYNTVNWCNNLIWCHLEVVSRMVLYTLARHNRDTQPNLLIHIAIAQRIHATDDCRLNSQREPSNNSNRFSWKWLYCFYRKYWVHFKLHLSAFVQYLHERKAVPSFDSRSFIRCIISKSIINWCLTQR